MPERVKMEDIPRLLSDLADYISRHQLPSGAIPWYDEGITDPWDHVECAIALDLTGRFDRAVMAYRWMKNKQNPDGSWYSGYVDDKPKDLTRDTNHSTYVATGVWYHYLVTKDEAFLREMWPSVQGAIDFAFGSAAAWRRDSLGPQWSQRHLAGGHLRRIDMRLAERQEWSEDRE